MQCFGQKLARTLVTAYQGALKERLARVRSAGSFGDHPGRHEVHDSDGSGRGRQRDSGAPAYYDIHLQAPALGGALGATHGLDNAFLFGSLQAGLTRLGPEI